jgi:hypothetical protein
MTIYDLRIDACPAEAKRRWGMTNGIFLLAAFYCQLISGGTGYFSGFLPFKPECIQADVDLWNEIPD